MARAKSVAIIGAGHMGSAIALGLKRSNLNMSITAIDPDCNRRNKMTKAGIPSLENLPNLITSETIILAIPPQAFVPFAENNPQLEQYAGMTISVMAGINISELTNRLKTSQICRAIPNLPCIINKGTTILISTPQTTQENNFIVNDLFSKLGILLIAKDEKLIDDATALVGGGPAYISYFVAALIEYAILAGFDKASASEMVIQTLRGTSALLEISQESPMGLCEQVMTPQGTTEQAINLFNNKKVRAIIVDGLKHSCMRSKELGRRS